MDSRQFFDELFEGMIGEGVSMYVWTPGQGSTYFTSTEKAALYVEATKAGKDIYYGLGATRAKLSRDKRPTNMQVCGIPGLWLDIDIADDAHKKKNLPPSQEEAIDLLESNLPLRPTILTHSGHGLHAYWLFKEPWLFETEDERVQAATLLRRFVLSFKYHAALRGWTLDSVFDLARVLRVPGTNNCKIKDCPLPCTVLSFEPENRFNPDDFDRYLVDNSEADDESISQLLSSEKNPLELFLRAGATPPYEKMETLRTVEPKFEATWERKRPDLKDQSLSTYEMSLVSLAVSYGWDNQEIADTVVAFRRRHGKNPKEVAKGMRVDYITRTILKARKTQTQDPVDPKILELSKQAVDSKQDPEKGPPAQSEIRTALEGPLQIKIDKIIKYACDNPIFEIRLQDGGIIPIGTIDRLITQRNLKNAIAAHQGVVIKSVKTHVWDEYATLMLQLVETVEPLAEDTTEKGILTSMITEYVEKMGVLDDMESALYSARPFTTRGRVFIFSKHFVNWTKFNAEPITIREFSMTARSIGITTESLHFRFGEDERRVDTTRSVYDITVFVPKELMPGKYDPTKKDDPTAGLEVMQ